MKSAWYAWDAAGGPRGRVDAIVHVGRGTGSAIVWLSSLRGGVFGGDVHSAACVAS